MRRELNLLMLILIICLRSFGQTKNENKNKDPHQNTYNIDTSVIAILYFDSSQYWVFKNSKPADLTNEDILTIETIIKNCVKDYNPEQERAFKEINDKHPEYKLDKKNFIIDLTRYKRQYIAVSNSKGEKEVWVNCFCRAGNRNWKKDLIFVKDGGNCYFNLKINLKTRQYYELMVNGDA